MDDLLVFVNLICLVLTIMVVWFKSSAFVEYCNLLGLKKLLLGYDRDPNSLTFPQYLYVKSRTLIKCSICRFIVSLITCTICLAFWLSLIVACIYGSILLTPIFYIPTLIIYFFIDRIIG